MGYIQHHAIIVTGYDEEDTTTAYAKAKEMFSSYNLGALVSDIIVANNGYASFFIAPDGSEEGWATSDDGDTARREFLDWLNREPDNYSDYVEVTFGGDYNDSRVIRDKDKDLNGE